MIIETLIYISIYLGLFVMVFYIISYFSNLPKEFKKIPDTKLPSITIIVPAWNEEEGIGKTIQSLLKIDYPKKKLEILVVDDGSKDKTYEEALKHQSSQVKVFKKKENGGKFTALNFGIEKAKGEFIVSTDADNLEVMPDALKHMVRYFENPSVMCVAPAMAISNPRGVLARIQQVEYLLGVFLRRAFASVNAIHVTPGAFSSYRKKFVQKTGGFKRAHLTEDMEMALRVQKHNYIIENSLNSIVYTIGLTRFKELLIQRRRWYVGLIRNLWDYKMLFSPRYGIMGVLVLPMAIWAIFTTIVFSLYVLFRGFFEAKRQAVLFGSINFDIFHPNMSAFILERSFLKFATTPLMVFTLLFIIVLVGYMIFAKKWVKKHSNVKYSLVLFLLFYSFIACIWWIDALIHSTVRYKKLKWR